MNACAPPGLFEILRWTYLDDFDHFIPWKEIPSKYFASVYKKTKLVHVCHRWQASSHPDPQGDTFRMLKSMTAALSYQFDGFYYDYSCLPQHPFAADEQGVAHRKLFQNRVTHIKELIQQGYTLLASTQDVNILERGWICFEFLLSMKSHKLIINDIAQAILKKYGTAIEFSDAEAILKSAHFTNRADLSTVLEMLRQVYEQPPVHGSKYRLLPIAEMKKPTWEEMKAVPLEHVDPDEVLMISHRWETPEHPDPAGCQLKSIQDFLDRAGGDHDPRGSPAPHKNFRYVFFDFVCLSQEEPIRDLLVVNELYARSQTLCLATGDYYTRSWCLFELALATFNRGSPRIEGGNHEIIEFFQQMNMIKELGFVSVLPSKVTINGVDVFLPQDRLHLKTQLRSVFLASQLTNKGDLRIILNLLDKLI